MGSDAHRQIEDLIPRYATLQREGKDPAKMYPQVARHLEHCFECQELLEGLLAPVVPSINLTLDPDDLPFFQSRPSSLSSRNSPPPSSPAVDSGSSEVMRGFSAVQSGGRLLMQETFTLGEQNVAVVLTLHPGASPDTFTITGEIYADTHSSELQAHLNVNGIEHVANTAEGELVFQDVKLDRSDPHFDLTLELLN